jgi:hypothetical protein
MPYRRSMRHTALALAALAACWTPAAAQGPPYVREEIPAAEKKQLAALLDVVRNAERVDALPVGQIGEGLSSTAKVEEKPVLVAPATGRGLGRILTRYEWTSWSPMACMFQPGVAFRFTRGKQSTTVLVCFMCGEMALEDIDGRLGQKKKLDDDEHNAFLRAAKKAFPKAFDGFDEVSYDDVKTKNRAARRGVAE